MTNVTMVLLHVELLFLLSIIGIASSAVSLTSSLDGSRSTAYPHEPITFRCVTRGSTVIAWSSDEYIGVGMELDFTSAEANGTTRTSTALGGSAVATLTGITASSDGILLESTLQINASTQFPTSDVTCIDVDNGGRTNTTTLRTTSRSAVELASTLSQGQAVCPGDTINFTCTTRDSNILAWSSDEYIGQNNSQLIITASGGGLPVHGLNSTAFLVDVDEEGTVLLITSILTITVLPTIDHQEHSVICTNIDVGVRNITRFTPSGHCGVTVTTSAPSLVTDETTYTRSKGFSTSWNGFTLLATMTMLISLLAPD